MRIADYELHRATPLAVKQQQNRWMSSCHSSVLAWRGKFAANRTPKEAR